HAPRSARCSSVSRSILRPRLLSSSQATFRSRSSGTGYTRGFSSAACSARYPAETAWIAKLMSMISTGWPCPAAIFRRRPSATRWIRLPSARTYSSTNSRARRFDFARRSRSAFEISLSKWPAFPRTNWSFGPGKCAAVTMSLPPAGSAPMVQELLHLRVVHVDHRQSQRAVPLHRPEPHHAGRRLLVPPAHALQQVRPLRVQEEHEVRAVVHHEVRLQIEDLVQARIVLLVRLPFLRIDVEAMHLCEGRRDAVVGGEGIARREPDLGPGLLEREGEDARLRFDMERHADPQTAQALLLLQLVPDRREDRHVVAGPLDSAGPPFGQLGHRGADARGSTSVFRFAGVGLGHDVVLEVAFRDRGSRLGLPRGNGSGDRREDVLRLEAAEESFH